MEDESDNDEGFVTTRVEIKESEHSTFMHKNKADSPTRYQRPHDYHTRYIFGEGVMRKEPVEVYNRFHRFIEEKCIITPIEHSSETESREKLSIEQQNQFEQNTNTNETNIYETNTQGENYLEGKEYTEQNRRHNSFETKKTNKFSTMNIFNTLNDVSVPKYKLERDRSGHPYHLFFANPKYQVLYSRIKDREETITEDNDDFSENYVNLSKVLTNYDGDHYSILKPFEYINLINNNTVPRLPSNSNIVSPGIFYQKPTTPSERSVQSHSKSDLQFDSKFECGNLLFALRDNESTNSYILFIHNDTNSYGYNQWFYFSIKGACKNIPYRFSIVNIRKKKSMFQEGMQPSMFSLKEAQSRSDGNGWSKTGTNIRYEKSPIRKTSDKKFRFFCLSFEVNFKNDDDYICLAMNTPYSYSRLLHHLKLCMDINEKSTISTNEENERSNKVKWKMEAIGYSISNNAVPYITIESELNNNKAENEKQKLILIMARQHPGETLSSFMMEEMLYLLAENNNLSISSLLSEHTIKIFPMINVDGVIYGNFRCDIGGFDLNRNWRKPDKVLHPQISSISMEIERLSKIYDIKCVLDLHGHSKKYNSFSYACKNDPISARVLSLMMSLKSEFFDFPSCTFGISKYKETTARAVIYKMLGNENILTIENSFFGARIQDKIILYDPFTLNKLSQSIFESVLAYVSNDELKVQCEEMIKKNIDTYLNLEKNEGIEVEGNSGSESDPFVDEICMKDKIKKILPKMFITIQQDLLLGEQIIKKKHIFQNNMAITKMRKSEKNTMKVAADYEALPPRSSKKIQLKNDEKDEIESAKHQPIRRASLSSSHRKKNSIKEQNEKEKSTQRGEFKIKQELKRHTPIPHEGVKLTKIEIKEQTTPLNKSEFMNKVEDVSLPFNVKEKQKLTPLKLKNELIHPFGKVYNATSKHFDTNENKLQKTIVHTSERKVKLASSSRHNSFTEEIPLLCILSEEKKRRANLQKTYGTFKEKISISLPHKNSPAGMHGKLESMRNNIKMSGTRNNNLTINDPITNRSKIKDNAILISNAWRENFVRYGKDLNVFFGVLKT